MACGEDCCKRCCYSTPYGTLFALGVIVVGLIGFIASSIYGIVTISDTEPLSQHVLIFGPVIGGLVLISILPLVFSTIMAYCVTGYIRDELFSNVVKNFIGSCCSFCSMCVNFSLFLLWLLLVVALSAVMTVFIQLKLSCDDIDSGDVDLECLPGNNYTFLDPLCGDDLDSLCSNGESAGIAFVVTLVFAIFIIFGIVFTLIIQGANYVNARENMEYRRSYQPRNNNDDYAMKRVR